jgi:hypothetical protein
LFFFTARLCTSVYVYKKKKEKMATAAPTPAPGAVTPAQPKTPWLFWSDIAASALFALSQSVDGNIQGSASMYSFFQQAVASVISRAIQSSMWENYAKAVGSEPARRYIISSVVATVLSMWTTKKKASVSTFLNSAGSSAVGSELIASLGPDKPIW